MIIDPTHRTELRKDSRDIDQAFRFALGFQAQVDSAIQELKRVQQTAAASSLTYTTQLQVRLLKSIESSSEGLRNFIGSMVHPRLYHETAAQRFKGSAAERVFGVAELLEMILLYTDMQDIINMRQTNKAIRSWTKSVKAQPNLYRSLFLIPAPKSALRLPSLLNRVPGFEIGIELVDGFYQIHCEHGAPVARVLDPEPIWTLNARFDTFGGQRLPKISRECQTILLCQPPITGMEYYFHCCGSRNGLVSGSITAVDGLRVGHLQAKTREIMESHKVSARYASNV